MTKQSFIKGTMILLAAGLINRLLGFIPRIALPRIIGAEGVGLYQLGYPFLIVILTLITGGIPLAIAKLIAEAESEGNQGRIRTILRVTLGLVITLSTFFTLVCLVAAPWITTHLMTDDRVYYTFLAMSPMILIVGVSSVYRGYFQGRHNMIPTATSQLIETLGRIVGMIVLSYLMLPLGIEFAAAGAMLGVVIGELAGLLVLYIQFHKQRHLLNPSIPYTSTKPSKESHMAQFRKVLRISVPVTGGKMVGSFSYFFESIMIAQSLSLAGIAAHAATTQYGALQGMVIPILLLPTALTYSLSVSLIPSLSEAAARNDMHLIHKRLHQSLRLALVIGAPCSVLMYVLAEPLCKLLYNNIEIASMLKLMAPFALFLYFQAPLQATLQALNRPGTALLNTFIGAAIKLILIYQLATQPQLGIIGAVIAINVNILLVTILHWHSVSRLLKFSMKFSDFFKVATGMALMAACAFLVMQISWTSSFGIRFVSSALSSILLYLLCMIWFQLIDRDDLIRVPWFGRKLTKWL